MFKEEDLKKQVFEKCSFKKIYTVEEGLEVVEEDGLFYAVSETGNKFEVQRDEIVIVQFNQRVFERLREINDLLNTERGITSPESISASKPFVKHLMSKHKIKTESEQVYVLNQIQLEMQSWQYITMLQSIYLGLVADDFFLKITDTSFETRYDVSVPNDYWSLKYLKEIVSKDKEDNTEKNESSFDSFLRKRVNESKMYFSPRIKKTDPVENMVAMANVFISNNESLSKVIVEHFNTILSCIGILNNIEEYRGDKDYFRLNADLDELLNR